MLMGLSVSGGKGTGLGLALVRQIVKRSGGRLGVQSKVNEGSTFWVELRMFLSMRSLVKSHSYLSHPTALGVGSKVVAGMTTPDSRLSGTQLDPDRTPTSFRPRPPTRSKSFSPLPTPPPDTHRSSSALHSIMEQGA